MERLLIVYRWYLRVIEVIVFVAEVKFSEVNKVGKAATRVDGTTCTETTLAKLKSHPTSNNYYFCLQASMMQT